MDNNRHWVGTWATAPAPSEAGVGFNNHTVRMNPRVSIGGDTVRVRVSNAYGTGPLAIGAAHVGLRDQGPAIVPGSDAPAHLWRLRCGDDRGGRARDQRSGRARRAAAGRPGGQRSICPARSRPSFQITGRYARQTNYISPPGNFAAAIVMPVGKITDDWFFVSGIDVLASHETGGVVALGDSLTDANISTHDAYCRWPDQLARRLIARQGGRPIGGDEPGARRQPDPARYARRQRPAALRPRRAGAARRDPCDRHARHQRSAQPLRQARGGGHRRADDRRPPPDGGAGPGTRDQDRSAPP